jgi:hypothetical protein
MTHNQIRAQLNQMLNGIWRMGDRDECSIKHTGYGLIAIAFDRPWTDAVDYQRPWDSDVDAPPSWHGRLDAKWAKVAALREKVGHDAWDAAVRDSDFQWYYQVRMDDAVQVYGISPDDPTLAKSREAYPA